MTKFLLLIFTLMTGCEASSTVKGCNGGWVEFTCSYPDTNKTYRNISIANPGKLYMNTNASKVKRFNLHHDTMSKSVTLLIKQFQKEDNGKYKCQFKHITAQDNVTWTLENEKDGCQEPFTQTAYVTAQTTITCDYPNKYNSSIKFLCKDNNVSCEEILSTQSPVKSNGTFTLTDTNRGFNVSVSNVSSQHAGVYWCGVKPNEESYRASLRKIKLEVTHIGNLTRSLSAGQTLTYWCKYKSSPSVKKFICKGEDPSICQSLLSTSKPDTTGKFSIKDNKKDNITITIRDLKADDSGTYWCGAYNTDGKQSHMFFTRLDMTVVSPTPSSAETIVIITAVCVVAVLLLVLILVLVCKRCSRSKKKPNEEVQNDSEDFVYEEINENPNQPERGTAMKTIYVSANHPTNPSAFTHHPDFKRPNGSSEVSVVAYANMKHSGQRLTYCTVNHPSRFTEAPLYSSIGEPQNH